MVAHQATPPSPLWLVRAALSPAVQLPYLCEHFARLQAYESNHKYSCVLSCHKLSRGQNTDCSHTISSLTYSHTESCVLGRQEEWRRWMERRAGV